MGWFASWFTFFKEVKSEASKVVWPDRAVAVRMLFVVCITVFIVSLIFLGVDSLMYRVIMLLLGA